VKKDNANGRILAVIITLLSLAIIPSLSHPVSAATQSSTGILVPLYAYPGSTWTALIEQKQANPSVTTVAAINPNGGSGSYSDPNFVSGIKSLQAAGITVVGYTTSSYASRSIDAVESEIHNYVTWYGVNGVYIDEMSNVVGHESYYSSLTSYAKSIGASLVIGNPGADVPSSYIGTVDTIVIYENSGLPSQSFLAGWHTGYAKSNFAIVAYADSFQQSFVQSASSYLGYIYTTDGVWPNPYSSLPSYLGPLMSTIAQSGQTGGPSSSLIVGSVDQNGSPIAGYYVVLYGSGGSVLGTGFTPATFTTTAGQAYSVQPGNYGSCSFNHWQDSGSTTSLRALTATSSSQTLTAVYNCIGAIDSSGPSTISVSAVTSNGSPLSGYYVTLWQNGALIGSCFTTCSFSAKSGQTYQVAASGYGSEIFSHWKGDGATGYETVTVPSVSTTISLTAVYS
jgi:hypothetical protein